MQRGINLFSRIPPWLYLIILSLFIFFPHPINVSSDLKVYSCNALNISLGNGYVDIDGSPILFRPPLFPFMLALSYLLFGISNESTFWVIKIFCVLNPILIYAIGKRFFGRGVGISAALLMLSSYTILITSFWHLDVVWPFFVLLSTIFFYLGFEEQKTRYFLFAGLSLALAYLVKNVAIIFFPLPFMMFFFIKDYRKKTIFPKILLGFTVTFTVILPWLFYLILHDHAFGLNLIIGRAGSGVFESIANPSESASTQILTLINLSKLKYWSMGLWHYYNGSEFAMDKWFTIAPFFIIAWCFVLAGAIRGNRHLRILILHVMLLSPIIYIQGAREMRIGQTLIVFLLSYLALAAFIDSVLKIVSRRVMKVKKVMSIIFMATIACLITGQIFLGFRSDAGSKEFFNKNPLFNAVFCGENGDRNYENKVITEDKRFLEIIEKFSTPPNKLYMAITNRSLAKEIYFNLKGRNTIYYLESQIRKGRKEEKSSYSKEQPIYLTVMKRKGSRPHSLKAVYRSQIIQMIKEENITHVLVELFNKETGGNRGLNRYFSVWPAFKRIPVPVHDISIYKVISDPKTSPALPPVMDIETLGAFTALSTEKGEKNLRFLKKCFKIICPSFTCERLDDNQSDFKQVTEEMNREGLLLNNRGRDYFDSGEYGEAIKIFKQAICLNPDLSETYRNLFHTYAILERKEAISLNPENPVSYYHYALFLKALGIFEAAKRSVQKAISLDTNYAKAYVTLGSLYAKQNKHYKAIDAFEQAVTIYRNIIGPRKENILSNTLISIGDSYLNLQKISKARESYKDATRITPNPVAYYKLAILQYGQYDYLSAIGNLQKTVFLRPNFSKAYYALFQIYQLNGDRENAIKQYKKLKKIDKALAGKLKETTEWTLE